jgi:Conserved TM helix
MPEAGHMATTVNLAAIDIGGGISSAWSAVANFVPKLVAFLVILLIGWIIAKVLGKIVGKVLNKVGFDRVVERGSLKTMLDRANYDASTLIAKVVYYAILLIALEVAFGVFGPNPISNILTAIVAWLPKLIVAMLIIIVVGAIATVVKDLVSNVLSGLSYGRMLGTIASVFIWGLGIIAALNQIGVATAITTPILITVLATVGGIAVVGFGGGLIRPMQQRWETWINRAEQQLPAAQGGAEAYRRGREDAARSGRPAQERDEERTGEMPTAQATAAYQSAQTHTSGRLDEGTGGPGTGTGPAAGENRPPTEPGGEQR